MSVWEPSRSRAGPRCQKEACLISLLGFDIRWLAVSSGLALFGADPGSGALACGCVWVTQRKDILPTFPVSISFPASLQLTVSPSPTPALLPCSGRCTLRQELFSHSFVTKNNNNKSLQCLPTLPSLLCWVLRLVLTCQVCAETTQPMKNLLKLPRELRLQDPQLEMISLPRVRQNSRLLIFIYLFVFWQWHAGILVPWLGIEPVPLVLKAGNFNHWTSREVPILLLKNFHLFKTYWVLSTVLSTSRRFCYLILVDQPNGHVICIFKN